MVVTLDAAVAAVASVAHGHPHLIPGRVRVLKEAAAVPSGVPHRPIEVSTHVVATLLLGAMMRGERKDVPAKTEIYGSLLARGDGRTLLTYLGALIDRQMTGCDMRVNLRIDSTVPGARLTWQEGDARMVEAFHAPGCDATAGTLRDETVLGAEAFAVVVARLRQSGPASSHRRRRRHARAA